jgi:hypothetical protein
MAGALTWLIGTGCYDLAPAAWPYAPVATGRAGSAIQLDQEPT